MLDMKFAIPAVLALSMAIPMGAAHAQAAMSSTPSTFYATPMNSGAPENLPGESVIPGMSLAMHTVNTVTQPILQPILAPGGAAPAGAGEPMAAPMHHRMHHRMMMHQHMMMHHKKMMKKSM